MRCNLETQNLISKMLMDIFKDALVRESDEMSGTGQNRGGLKSGINLEILPSPEDLKGRVVIKAKCGPGSILTPTFLSTVGVMDKCQPATTSSGISEGSLITDTVLPSANATISPQSPPTESLILDDKGYMSDEEMPDPESKSGRTTPKGTLKRLSARKSLSNLGQLISQAFGSGTSKAANDGKDSTDKAIERVRSPPLSKALSPQSSNEQLNSESPANSRPNAPSMMIRPTGSSSSSAPIPIVQSNQTSQNTSTRRRSIIFSAKSSGNLSSGYSSGGDHVNQAGEKLATGSVKVVISKSLASLVVYCKTLRFPDFPQAGRYRSFFRGYLSAVPNANF
jgi:hypothetical protein